jgi:hypothetical protein
MRSSLLTRSVVAVASLAIGSVALAAVPATAATPSGTTREQVLALAAAARADALVEGPTGATQAAARAILAQECDLTATQEIFAPFDVQIVPVETGAAVDGVAISGVVSSSGSPTGNCVVGIVTPVAPRSTLSGTGNLTLGAVFGPATTAQATLSGDVGVVINPNPGNTPVNGFTFTAGGTSTQTTQVTTTVKVKDTKSKAEKKAAKKKYDKRVKAAKKSYKKALAKAKSSKSKKAAAKKSYKAKLASARKSYKKAIAGFKLVKRTTTQTQSTPFSVKAERPGVDF